MKETAIVIGASSGLGRELCTLLAKSGCDIILSSRNFAELSAVANDIKVKYGIKADALPVDLSKIDNEKAIAYVNKCFEISPSVNQVYLTAAIVNDNDKDEKSVELLREIFDTNFFGTSFLAAEFAKRLCKKQSNITVISSVAAIRIRSKNMAYSSSKIALEYFVSGLRHSFSENKMNIQIYRIGYMDTPMIAGKEILLPPVSPQKVADYIIKHRETKFAVRYFPFYWKFVAMLLPLVPWFIFKKFKH